MRKVKIGPRREIALQIETWPQGKAVFGAGEIVTVRFGALRAAPRSKSSLRSPCRQPPLPAGS